MKQKKERSSSITRRQLRRTKQLWLFVLPAVVMVAIFNYIPMYGVVMAFQDFTPSRGFLESPWVGFEHFIRFFNSYSSSSTIRNTILISLESLIWTFPIPILFALILNQIGCARFKRTVQTVTYIPYFISTVVLVSLVTLFLTPYRGFFGAIVSLLGMEDPINPITDPACFRPVYIGSTIWQTTGYSSILYLAALSGVDPALHEAAKIDGASRWKRLLHIELPTLIPTVSIMFIMQCGSIMNVGFEKAFLMQNKLNLEVSEVLQTYVYKVGLVNAQYSFSAAINLFSTVINIALLLIVNQVVKKLSQNSLI